MYSYRSGLATGAFACAVVFQVANAIALSLFAVTYTSIFVGAAVPLLFNRMGIDPAHGGPTVQVSRA